MRRLAWRVFIDTAKAPPADVHPDAGGPAVDVDQLLNLPERSLVCLVADVARPPLPRQRIAPKRA